jgi:hypothetical protein
LRRGIAFRLGAVLLGLSPLLVGEVTLRIVDWRPRVDADPFLGFRQVRPLFLLNAEHSGLEEGPRYEIPPARQAIFRPASFAAEKSAKEFRIFCLGGSTVQGRPFATETSFTTWLELSLRAAEPDRKWRVINCGGVSYASYRLVPILEEVLEYEPDLLIVYTGHNEFLEARTYGHLKNPPAGWRTLVSSLHRLRTTQFLRAAFGGSRQGQGRQAVAGSDDVARPILPEEVEALLDYRGSLEKYRFDPEGRRNVVLHFRYNLMRMVSLARGAGVPLVLVNPVSNLRNSPPFKSQYRPEISAAERAAVESHWTRADQLRTVSPAFALPALEQALSIDSSCAMLHYDLAKCYDRLGRLAEAKEAYVQAKECDLCPLRAVEPLHDALVDVARQTGSPLVDIRGLFETLSATGIPGNDWLVDHVHPSIQGHQKIAEKLHAELARLGLVGPEPTDTARRDRLFREHHDSLDGLYFAKGMQRLENLRLWAAGRVARTPPQKRRGPPGKADVNSKP